MRNRCGLIEIITTGEEYAAEIKWLFQSYPDEISHYFDGVRLFIRIDIHKSELLSEELIF